MAPPNTPPPNKLPPGTSLNESLEWRTLVHRFPNADPTNKGQKGVDFTEGASSVVRTIPDPKTQIDTLHEVRTGGKWIQNKLLEPVKETEGIPDSAEVLRRVNRNVKLAMEKLDSQLRMPKAITRSSSDGSRYRLDLEKPESFLIHLEIPGIGKHRELKGALNAAANNLVGRYDNEGLPVRVEIDEAPPSGAFEVLGAPVSDLNLPEDEFVVKYRVAIEKPARVVGAGETETGANTLPAESVTNVRVATGEGETGAGIPTAEPGTRVRVATGEPAAEVDIPGNLASGGLRSVGGIGLTVGMAVLFNWLRDKTSETFAERELERIKPEIRSKLDALILQRADLQLRSLAIVN